MRTVWRANRWLVVGAAGVAMTGGCVAILDLDDGYTRAEESVGSAGAGGTGGTSSANGGAGTNTGGMGGSAEGPCEGGAQPEPEECNGADDDCDGTVDEECPCANGSEQSCYTGDSSTRNKGECKDGTQVCSGGSWGSCEGSLLPSDETCDSKDNDCDDEVDEGLSAQSCGVGACQTVVPGCVDGQVPQCTEGQPSAESCNGIDDDCNGSTDDGLGVITCGVGECASSAPACDGGQQGVCTPKPQQAEVCDGKDNDCDGVADDGAPGGGVACNTGKPGVCSAGTTSCINGAVSCNQNVQASAETCDAKDNDCDGSVDESVTSSCYTGPGGTMGVGACKSGSKTCSNGVWGACLSQVTPTFEACNTVDHA